MFNILRKRASYADERKAARAMKPGKELDEHSGNEDLLQSPDSGKDRVGQGIADQIKSERSDGVGIDPGDETDELAGDEGAYIGNTSEHHMALAHHHGKLAAHHRALADPDHATESMETGASGGPEEEAAEMADFGGGNDSDALEGPAGHTGSSHEEGLPHTGGPGHNKEVTGEDLEDATGQQESPEEEAAESPQIEAEEQLGAAPTRGGGLRNTKGGNPLSKFNEMRKKKKGY